MADAVGCGGFEGPLAMAVFEDQFAHDGPESTRNKNMHKRRLKRELSDQAGAPSLLRRDLIGSGDAAPQHVPEARDVTRERAEVKSQRSLAEPGTNPAEMRALLDSRRRVEGGAKHLWYVPETESLVHGDTFIPLGCDHCFESLRDFVAKRGNHGIRLVYDATHEECEEGLKFLCVAAIGVHWDKQRLTWSGTVLPSLFALSDEERKVSVARLLATLNSVMKERYGVDLPEVVDYTIHDGLPGATEVFQAAYPNADDRECLQHVRARLSRHVGGGLGKQMANWLDHLAFVNPFVRHVAIDSLLEGLAAESTSSSAGTYLGTVCCRLDENGMYTAKWGSSWSEVKPGFSTYASNDLESFWAVRHILHGRLPKHEAACAVFARLDLDAKVWMHGEKFATIQHAPCGKHT